jgi:hypothetical protein
MKLNLKRKIGEVWIQHLEFLRNPILLHDLETFSLLSQDGCSRLSVGFVRLRNQNITSIKIREKMEYLGEKIKTHLKKFLRGPGLEISPSGS